MRPAVSASTLIVVNRHFLVNPVLHQRIHDSAVDLAEEAAGVVVVFGYDYEAVIVQNVAVQFLVGAGLLTRRCSRALFRRTTYY